MKHLRLPFPLALCLLSLGAFAAESGEREFVVTLRGNPSTGQFWHWTATGEGRVREKDVVYKQQYENVPGSPATYGFVFAGEKPGAATLRFRYSRSDTEQPGDRVNIYTIHVLPDLTIVMDGMEEDLPGG